MKRWIALLTLLAALPLLAMLVLQTRPSQATRSGGTHGEIISETTSAYSHIRVRERGSTRHLLFVDREGRERLQSSMDLAAPHVLQLHYSRAMFASLLLRFPQERILIVGLGGGSMVRFAREAMPGTLIDAVEIDPEVIRIAERYFGTTAGPRTTIYEEDAFLFLREPHGPYDVIYMDAFLKPSAESGLDELTQRLKTVSFLQELQSRLEPEGLVVLNLITTDPETASDIEALQEAFPSVTWLPVTETRNLIALASRSDFPLDPAELLRRVEGLETQTGVDLPFRQYAASLTDQLREPATSGPGP